MNVIFALLFLYSPISLIIGLIRPKWAFFGKYDKATRLKATGLSAAIFVSSLVGFGATTSPEIQRAASTSSAPVAAAPEQPAAAPAKTPQPQAKAKVGEAVSISDRSVVVQKVERTKTIESGNQFIESPVAKGQFVIVTIEAKNTGNETGNLAFSTFELTDGQGRKYSSTNDFSAYMAAANLAPDQPSDDIPPGLTSNIALIFDVALDASGLTMHWKGNEVDLGV